MTKKVNVYIDGFNFYHALQNKIRDKNSKRIKKYQRCNFKKLAEQFLKKGEKLQKVYFFTAYATRDPETKKRHESYNEALRKSGVDVILGKFNKITRTYREKKNTLIDIKFLKDENINCKEECVVKTMTYATFEEKETDVNIALKILEEGLL